MTRDRTGVVLVAVLLLTLVTWALLAALLTSAFLQYRLALGADRGTVAGAAAASAVATLAEQAAAHRRATGAWPSSVVVADRGACELTLVEAIPGAASFRVAVEGRFEGAIALREATVHAP